MSSPPPDTSPVSLTESVEFIVTSEMLRAGTAHLPPEDRFSWRSVRRAFRWIPARDQRVGELSFRAIIRFYGELYWFDLLANSHPRFDGKIVNLPPLFEELYPRAALERSLAPRRDESHWTLVTPGELDNLPTYLFDLSGIDGSSHPIPHDLVDTPEKWSLFNRMVSAELSRKHAAKLRRRHRRAAALPVGNRANLQALAQVAPARPIPALPPTLLPHPNTPRTSNRRERQRRGAIVKDPRSPRDAASRGQYIPTEGRSSDGEAKIPSADEIAKIYDDAHVAHKRRMAQKEAPSQSQAGPPNSGNPLAHLQHLMIRPSADSGPSPAPTFPSHHNFGPSSVLLPQSSGGMARHHDALDRLSWAKIPAPEADGAALPPLRLTAGARQHHQSLSKEQRSQRRRAAHAEHARWMASGALD